MLITRDPIILYSPDGRRDKRFAAIDALGWINAGWSLTPIEKPVLEDPARAETPPNPESSPPSLDEVEIPQDPESPPPKTNSTKKK